MFNNYHYFLILCEEMNIARAANRLYISHQSLSSYIRSLEAKYGASLFIRKPQLKLTPAGFVLLNSLREVERIEKNLLSQISDLMDEQSGIVNFGTTEGRYRIIVPPLLKEYSKIHPKVQIRTFSFSSHEMEQKLLDNQLDVFLGFETATSSNMIKSKVIGEEYLYMIISDNLLKKYYPDTFPHCKEMFKQGADLRLFEKVPFVLNKQMYNSRKVLENHLNTLGIKLNCITEISQPDIHIMLCASDYAASFCFSGYLPTINNLNETKQCDSKINVFPISDLYQTKTINIFYLKDRIFPQHVLDLIKLIKNLYRSLL